MNQPTANDQPRMRRRLARLLGRRGGRPDALSQPRDNADVIAHYRRLWDRQVACVGGPLPGARLTDGKPFEHGIEFLAQLTPSQWTQTIANSLPGIAAALDHPAEQLVIDAVPGDVAHARLRLVTTVPLTDPYFRHPSHADGDIVLGPHVDGMGYALWRHRRTGYCPGGLIVGDNSEQDALLEQIALSAMAAAPTHVVYLDGKDGASSPALWKHASERYGRGDVDHALDRLHAMVRYRGLRQSAGGFRFAAAADYPAILVVIHKADRIVTPANVDRWRALTRFGRRSGLAIAAATNHSTQAIRDTLLHLTNLVVLGTRSPRVATPRLPGRTTPAQLPSPAFGQTLAETATRSAPFVVPRLPSRLDADRARAAGCPLASDLLLLEDHFELAHHAALDADTAAAAMAADALQH